MAAARAAKGHEAFKNTIFLGFNGDRAACEAILNGQMTMSVAQMAYEMGYKAVETMFRRSTARPLTSSLTPVLT